MAKIMQEEVPALTAEESKDENAILLHKLKSLRNTRVETQKKSNYGLKNMYHESFLFRILGLMDFYTSLSQVSPAALAFVQ